MAPVCPLGEGLPQQLAGDEPGEQHPEATDLVEQGGRQQGDSCVKSQLPVHCPAEFSWVAGFAGATNVGVMRFAFKTSPQETTWAQMLAVWKTADDIDVFES